MKKNITKLGAMALVGIMGMGLAVAPVSAATQPQNTTDVFYTTSSTAIDADGKVVMVVPARVDLTKVAPEKEIKVTMQTSNKEDKLPNNFSATVKVSSMNNGKLKEVLDGSAGTTTYAYKLLKNGQEINLEIESDFHTFELSQPIDPQGVNAIEQNATISAKDSVEAMEKAEKQGARFTDKLTFKVTKLTGDGLTQVK